MRTRHDSDFLHSLLQSSAGTLDTDLAVVARLQVEQDHWAVEALYSKGHATTGNRIVSSEALPLLSEAVAAKKPVVTSDPSDCPDALVWSPESKAGCSFMAIPLEAFGTGRSALAYLRVGPGRAFTEGDIERAKACAHGLSGVMATLRRSDELTHQNGVLKAKVQETERMFRDLVHEVKAPAGRMAQFATWIRQDCGHLMNARANEYLSWICAEAADLSTLADESLDLAESRYESPPLERVDVDLVLRDLLTLMEAEYRRKGIRVTVTGPLPAVLCHRLHVKRIFENLLSNAIKFMGEQPAPQIVIGVQETADGKALFVRDNGIGIESSMLERVFLPFERVHGENVSGAGLGLSIVKALADQCGGAVTVSSEVGQGSTFWVRLPSAPDGEHGSAAPQTPRRPFRTARESEIRS